MIMARRFKHTADDDECAPRPVSAYLLLGVLVAVVLVSAYLNRDAITALVTDALVPQSSVALVVSEPAAPAPAEPNCAAECGRACWLVSSGAAEGTFSSASGNIGNLGCDGMCRSVSDTLNGRCCRNADCPKTAPLCRDGVCSSSE